MVGSNISEMALDYNSAEMIDIINGHQNFVSRIKDSKTYQFIKISKKIIRCMLWHRIVDQCMYPEVITATYQYH